MKENGTLQVLYDGKVVGNLALMAGRKIAFEYSEEWLETGFSISPFSLPLKEQVFIPTKEYFGGLFGVFGDSLPDGWGNLLLNRMLRKKGMKPEEMTMLNRLAIVGQYGMGALTYRPEEHFSFEPQGYDLDDLALQCQKILNTEYSEKLDELYLLGGTSGGARPKIMTEIDGEDWIIKFPAHVDGQDAGGMEYEYALCAKACGIDMTEVRLFPSKKCKGYFGIKRFDRERIVDGIGTKVKAGNKKKRIHMLTAAALLELDFEQPSLDYHSLMKLTKILTRDNEADVREMFRRMCFNVFAHNRDDHSKNFTYLYDEMKKGWRLSPAYDLTFSNTYYGEHTTMVDGNGRNPGKKELLVVGMQAGLEKSWCEEVIEKIKNTVEEYLSYKPEPYELLIDNQTVKEKAFLVACGNASQYGNNAFIAPHANIQDGKMDITILSPFGPLDIAPLAIQLFTKQIDRNSKIKTFKGKEVTIIRQNPGVMHLDGEPIMADSRIEISVLPKSLNVLTPETVSFTEEVQNLFGEVTRFFDKKLPYIFR